MIKSLDDLFEYAVCIRRKLHEYPELEFELEKTVSLVTKELEKMGLKPNHNYCRGSVVAELGQGDTLIAIRADMDALPVEEETDVPFKSKISGQMHACGHDAHTAVLLAVAKYLKENENKLNCRVRLIFQPSEEGIISGASIMVKNGVMDGVNHIICAHCENSLNVGNIGICYGDYMAACSAVKISFIGKPSHAALPQFGIDANNMGSDAYSLIKSAIKEIAGKIPYIWNVGRIVGGHVSNIVSGEYNMDISFRYYDMNFAKDVEDKVNKICEDIANSYGGKFEISWNTSTYPLHNDENITAIFEKKLNEAGLSVVAVPPKMSSEDFAHYLTKAPGMLFRFGTRNEENGCTTTAHCNDFKIDENGMKYAINAFGEYVLNIH